MDAPLMESSRKQPGVAFWAAVVIVVALVAYPLSIGPACWMRVHLLPPSTREAMDDFYLPIGLINKQSEMLAEMSHQYISLWVDRDALWNTATVTIEDIP